MNIFVISRVGFLLLVIMIFFNFFKILTNKAENLNRNCVSGKYLTD